MNNNIVKFPNPQMKSFSPDQGEALEKITAWLKTPLLPGNEIFKLFGWAGTGKTFVAREITEIAEEVFRDNFNRSPFPSMKPYYFAAFTGKACHVMSKKGCSPVSTIHQLIYKLDKEATEAEGKPVFYLNQQSILKHLKLLILDECSMVNEALARDLLSFKVKILVLGDPEQLQPIDGSGFFTSGTPDHLLTEIHRQALESPIIKLAHAVRMRHGFKKGVYSENVRVVDKKSIPQWEEAFHLSDQILCGKNQTRQNFNLNYRKQYLSQPTHRPFESDKLICLKNDHEKGLLNGSMWEPVCEPRLIDNDWELIVSPMESEDQELEVSVRIPDEFFRLGSKGDLDFPSLIGRDQFTFGYAITVHKSQGSQWNSVFLYNENYCFREHSAKWLYTGITRAEEKLVIAI